MISTELLILILINTIFFFVLIIKSIATETKSNTPGIESILKAETAILAIAFTQYALTFIIENSNVLDKDSNLFAQQLRYIDWLITTPLLLYTFWKLARTDGYTGGFEFLLVADIVMILAGMIAEFYTGKYHNNLFYWIGCLAYVIIFIEIIRIMNFYSDLGSNLNRKNLGWFFIFGWLIYPLAYFFNDNIKYILYSIGDFINKGVYSLFLYSVI